MEREILEALQQATTMGEETLQDLQRVFSPPTPTFVVTSDSKEEEEQEEIRTSKPNVSQFVKPKGLTNVSSKSTQEGFFEVFEHASPLILVVVLTKACSKCMMKHKGKEVMEESDFHGKLT
jgi:hypothetical protein